VVPKPRVSAERNGCGMTVGTVRYYLLAVGSLAAYRPETECLNETLVREVECAAMPGLWSDVPLIDCESHLIGPLDLRSTCVPEKWCAEAPRVAWNGASREHTWHRQAVGAFLARTSR
jgi:hypothetical protein